MYLSALFNISGLIILKQAVREAATICLRPALCKLTFDLLTLKVASESRVTCATSVPILVFLGLSVLDLGPMCATDRQTSDAHHRLMPPPYGGGNCHRWQAITKILIKFTAYSPYDLECLFRVKTPEQRKDAKWTIQTNDFCVTMTKAFAGFQQDTYSPQYTQPQSLWNTNNELYALNRRIVRVKTVWCPTLRGLLSLCFTYIYQIWHPINIHGRGHFFLGPIITLPASCR